MELSLQELSLILQAFNSVSMSGREARLAVSALEERLMAETKKLQPKVLSEQPS